MFFNFITIINIEIIHSNKTIEKTGLYRNHAIAITNKLSAVPSTNIKIPDAHPNNVPMIGILFAKRCNGDIIAAKLIITNKVPINLNIHFNVLFSLVKSCNIDFPLCVPSCNLLILYPELDTNS